MIRHFGLRNQSDPEGAACIADLLLSMHSDLQQEPIAVDFVSCFASDGRDYDTIFDCAARAKRRKYFKYNTITEDGFFPLPFGRTNALSCDVLRFCTLIGNYLPPHVRARDKLLATFSRAIYSGVAQTFNVAFRRLQTSSHLRPPSLLLHSLLQPYVDEPPSRAVLRVPKRAPFADASLVEALAAVFAESAPGADFRAPAGRGLRRDAVVSGSS